MAKILDAKKYKLAKIISKDLSQILNDYDDMMKSFEIMQQRMKKWGAYSTANHMFGRLEQIKAHLMFERASIRAKYNKYLNIVKSKGEVE